ncbi:Endoribonuclease YSH1 [Pseudocercospora fuligena]|uniref:Endoribonuclease YSH1 n=1 Tax=Pseudocercospora fuligena TaxID=685502 RepID=A0A8H6VKE8_9PEZI|nr:Endoribonuclease YSH1 [Pseudocercospora fuligena]
MATKRPHSAMNAQAEDEDPIDPSDELMFLALGGGNEVGRSCHIIQYKGKTVMLDAGIHPSYEGLGALPFYDEFDLSTVDLLLITHFHQDHSASLPYVLSKTNFAGRVYMTHPTKAIYKWTTQDAVRVHNTHTPASSSSGTDGYVSQLYTEQDILSTMPMIQTISFHTTHSHNGIRFTPYPAGHVLGACMYLIEIAGLNILFTGDYSRETDRHLIPATVPRNVKVDCLITESTFGISTRTPRQERENALIKSITTILNRGGRVLMPTTAVGNTQELLLILEDYWQRHEEYRKFPIYYASGLARKVMVVYQTYVDDMNDTIKAKFQASAVGQSVGEGGTAGPWDFQFVRALKGIDRFEDVGGSVVLASPGMLQNGPSRALLERWAPEAKNGVVITGYSVEGTMAKTILMEPDEIPAVTQNRSANMPSMGKRGGVEGEKQMIKRRCTVQEFNFAVHVDGQENREFIEEVGAPVVILVHGEKHNMNRLKSRLLGIGKMKVYSPANCEEVRIPFRQEKVARVVGRLASQIQPPTLLPSPPDSNGEDEDMEEGDVKRSKAEHDASLGQVISGVLVQNDFKLSLMAPEDLKEYAGLATTTLVCRQHITLASASPDLIKWALEGTFGSITTVSPDSNGTKAETNGSDEAADEEVKRPENTVFEIMGGAVRLICKERGVTELEWEGNATNDGIADAVMAVLLTVETSPAAVKHSSKLHSHLHDEDAKDYDGFGDSPTGEKKANDAFPRRNPHANITPEDRLNRLFMFLEAQFGEESITPIAKPKLPAIEPTTNGQVDAEEANEVDAVDIEKKEANELARLHGLGIPVPGLEIKVDKSVAKVWLERLEVECANKTFGDRVRAVVERAVETIAPIWQ